MSKTGKIVCFIARTVPLVMLLQSITSHWTVTAQYLLALLATFVWGVTGYIEGLADEKTRIR